MVQYPEDNCKYLEDKSTSITNNYTCAFNTNKQRWVSSLIRSLICSKCYKPFTPKARSESLLPNYPDRTLTFQFFIYKWALRIKFWRSLTMLKYCLLFLCLDFYVETIFYFCFEEDVGTSSVALPGNRFRFRVRVVRAGEAKVRWVEWIRRC